MSQSSTPDAPSVSPEVAAVITAASAALEDFKREDAEFIATRGRIPDYVLWSVRLATELDTLLRVLGGDDNDRHDV